MGEFLEIRPQVTANFTYVWANFLHMGGRIFRVDFWVGEFSHVGGRISHTLMGELSGSSFFGRIFHISKIVGEFSHVGGRICHTLVGEFSGSILGGRIFHISTIVGEFSHVGGRISDTLVGEFSESGGRIFRVDFGWANFSHLNNSGRIFTCWWANFWHFGGRMFRVGWANFQGRFWVGEFFTSQQ